MLNILFNKLLLEFDMFFIKAFDVFNVYLLESYCKMLLVVVSCCKDGFTPVEYIDIYLSTINIR